MVPEPDTSIRTGEAVLVVDDDPAILDLYQEILAPPRPPPEAVRTSRVGAPQRDRPLSASYRLLLARSGDEAEALVRAEMAQGGTVICGFFDLRLAGDADGVEAIRRVRAVDPDLRVAVVTALDDASVEHAVSLFEGREDECAYLRKPFTALEIRHTAKALSRSRRRDERVAAPTFRSAAAAAPREVTGVASLTASLAGAGPSTGSGAPRPSPLSGGAAPLGSPLPGVDRYVVERLLGSGWSGKVYLARDAKLGRRVALKVVTADFESHGVDGVQAALREARAAAAISHPNVAAVYDVHQHGDQAIIAMEHVPGASLRGAVGDASIPLAQRVRWIVDVALALGAAHDVGVVHRDVKPENVIVRDDGVVKVVDFGIARLSRQSSGETTGALTWSQGAPVGTPGYMAPEMLRGEAVDARADQFGWGALGYELVAGQLPWSGAGNPYAVIASVLSEQPKPLGPEVPGEIAAVLLRALSKSPAARFPSIGEAASLLVAGAASPPARSVSLSGVASPAISDTGARASSKTTGEPERVSHPPPSDPADSRPASSQAGAPTSPRERGRRSSPDLAPAAPPSSSPGTALRPPDFQSAVDLDAHLALLPRGATCKGLFFQELFALAAPVCSSVDLAILAGIPERRYVAFSDYPLADYQPLAVAVARAVHPEVTLGEGLRRLGQRSLDTVLGSQFGKTLFGVFDRDIEPFILHGPRAYRVLVGVGEVTSTRVGPGEFRVRYRDMPIFLETMQVGVIEGLFRHCGVRGQILVAMDGLARATVVIKV